MVSLNQIEHGLALWADRAIVDKLPVGQGPYDNIKRIGVAAGAAYLIKKGMAALEGGQGSAFLHTLGAVDANGDIDLEGAKDALVSKIPDVGVKITFPLLNETTLYKADIESMYSYIMGG
jgi:hypothetical protein